MLAGHVKNFAYLEALQVLLERIEFFRFGKMTQVTGVQDEVRRRRQRVDLRDRLLQRADDIFVRLFVKTDVAVADLHEAEIGTSDWRCCAEQFRREDSTAHRPKHSSASPCHA